MITPKEIRAKAVRAYPRMLQAWLQDEELTGYFPLVLRVNLAPVKNDLPATIAAVDALRSSSKERRGWGYSIRWQRRRSRDFGDNEFPERVTIDTLDDLLRLTGRRRAFGEALRVTSRLREECPGLSGWVANHIRTLHRLAEPLDGLIEVAKFFVDNPRPDCYARQIPAAVDTKFVERYEPVLWKWLNLLLPSSAIQNDETRNFALRFGLRDGQPHWMVRTLYDELQTELGLLFDEFSAPLRILAELPVRDATAFIVENQVNLLTLPAFKRGIAVWGGGDQAIRLQELEWLGESRVVYWGDVDIEGFHILSRLRSFFPNGKVRSIMMDLATLSCHNDFLVEGHAPTQAEPPLLTDEERAAYRHCAERHQRLEQEKIPQRYVEERIGALAATL
jgi:hypothetical protein